MSERCIIQGCNGRGEYKARIDIGSSIGDALVAEEARLHDVRLCKEHHQFLAPHIKPGTISFYSIGD